MIDVPLLIYWRQHKNLFFHKSQISDAFTIKEQFWKLSENMTFNFVFGFLCIITPSDFSFMITFPTCPKETSLFFVFENLICKFPRDRNGNHSSFFWCNVGYCSDFYNHSHIISAFNFLISMHTVIPLTRI